MPRRYQSLLRRRAYGLTVRCGPNNPFLAMLRPSVWMGWSSATRRWKSVLCVVNWWSRAVSKSTDVLNRTLPLTVFWLVIFAATGVSLPAAIAVALLAALLTTVVATFAPAIIPDRVGQQFDCLHRDVRVVAGDQQFAAARALLGGIVTNGQT